MYLPTAGDKRDSKRVVVSSSATRSLQGFRSIQHLKQAIKQLELPTDGRDLKTSVGIGHVIGRCICVPTAPIRLNELTSFAKRHGAWHESQVTTRATSTETNLLTLIGNQSECPHIYVLRAAYYGPLAAPEIWDTRLPEDERSAATEFWKNHAFVYDPRTMGELFEDTWDNVLRRIAEDRAELANHPAR